MRKSVMVRQLDTTKLEKVIRRGLNAFSTEKIEAERMLVVNTPKGLATICSEGVGWFKNDNDMYLVGFYQGYSNPSLHITEDELLSCLSDTDIDMAEFISSFGDRLEVNYDLWYNQVKDVSQDIALVDFA
tara:strand:+ start:1931 stop:2320 length:390 start_codon:yes stop_codon:yes gene_type:complete